MPTVFETLWTSAARAAFLTTFGSAVVYQPSNEARSITAIVRYVQDDAALAPVTRHRSPLVRIKVANDSSIGISASEFAPNQTVSVPPRPGASARTMQLARIVKCGGTWVTYECH